MRYANRLHTVDRRAKDAMSMTAVCARISIRISDGIAAIGQGGGGDPSIGGSAGSSVREAKEAMSCEIVDMGGPPRE